MPCALNNVFSLEGCSHHIQYGPGRHKEAACQHQEPRLNWHCFPRVRRMRAQEMFTFVFTGRLPTKIVLALRSLSSLDGRVGKVSRSPSSTVGRLPVTRLSAILHVWLKFIFKGAYVITYSAQEQQLILHANIDMTTTDCLVSIIIYKIKFILHESSYQAEQTRNNAQPPSWICRAW